MGSARFTSISRNVWSLDIGCSYVVHLSSFLAISFYLVKLSILSGQVSSSFPNPCSLQLIDALPPPLDDNNLSCPLSIFSTLVPKGKRSGGWS
ncbi:hypothetical protein GALMADRAFT_932796 [Galerina marginata CBS 339.88]|uniref:Uncharacterized protein n=1 Tax=Galerina marginata (strain CBS 339.88) TaxID=685588 RepID=A0A067SMW1_GALM3|nr:hypothetical protein GALMADRAFT_932796 [Galerina marginata CBS 339.88]